MSLLLLFGGSRGVSVIGPISLQAEYSLNYALAGEQMTGVTMIGESSLTQTIQGQYAIQTALQGESNSSINLAGQV